MSRQGLNPEVRRRTPEEFLLECEAAESAAAKRGYLKIILGYASGVGKSFRMLDEARRRRERGQDVVVGAVQERVSPEVDAVLGKLEVIPLRSVEGRGVIDVDAIRERAPAVCFIDGLAYNNPPGSRNATRWQDVQELLDAGIKVVASINIQYVAELREQVERITGKRIADVVPVAFLKRADEIEIVDAPPEAPIERTPEEQDHAKNREQRLTRLRELALVLAADVVDDQLRKYLEEHGIRQQFGTHERVLVCVTPRANVGKMLQSAKLIAGRFHGELVAAYVNQPEISDADRAALEERLQLAREAGASIEILEGHDAVTAILDFARSRGITQLFIGHSLRSGLRTRLLGSPVDKLIERSRGMDVRVFPQ